MSQGETPVSPTVLLATLGERVEESGVVDAEDRAGDFRTHRAYGCRLRKRKSRAGES